MKLKLLGKFMISMLYGVHPKKTQSQNVKNLKMTFGPYEIKNYLMLQQKKKDAAAGKAKLKELGLTEPKFALVG
ncbi:MAG: hypothetical protein CM15mV54_710 [Caudoviricetes sp.]|nr:MAG: hypothetical protein CM15mV54_710 [Caudoviricetes sp.]